MQWDWFLVACASLAALICLAGSVFSARMNVGLLRPAESVLPSSSVSRQRNTTHYLNSREELARFVTDLRSLASDSQLTTIIKPDKFEGCCVSCATSESSEPALQVCLSRRLLTSLTHPELLCLEKELQRVVLQNDGVLYVERRW